MVHFGIEGTWPGIPHHSILFGPRYEGLLKDIYEHGVLPADFSIYLHHPTVTDPFDGAGGHEHLLRAGPGRPYGQAARSTGSRSGRCSNSASSTKSSRRLIPDLRDRIVTKFHYAPRDFALDLNAYLGSAFSLEPILAQSAFFRAHNRDDVIKNLYLVGAGTHPGRRDSRRRRQRQGDREADAGGFEVVRVRIALAAVAAGRCLALAAAESWKEVDLLAGDIAVGARRGQHDQGDGRREQSAAGDLPPPDADRGDGKRRGDRLREPRPPNCAGCGWSTRAASTTSRFRRPPTTTRSTSAAPMRSISQALCGADIPPPEGYVAEEPPVLEDAAPDENAHPLDENPVLEDVPAETGAE